MLQFSAEPSKAGTSGATVGGTAGVFLQYLEAKEQEGVARRKAKEAENEAAAARRAEKLADAVKRTT